MKFKKFFIIGLLFIIIWNWKLSGNIYSKYSTNELIQEYERGLNLMENHKGKEASKIFKNFLTIPEKIPKEIYIQCYLLYASANFAISNYHETIKTYNDLNTVTNITNLWRKQPMFLKYLYKSYIKINEMEKGVESLRLLFKIEKEKNQIDELWRTEGDLAHIYVNYLGKYKEGLSILKRYEDKNDSLIYSDIGIAYYNLGKIKLSEKYLHRALKTKKCYNYNIIKYLLQLINVKEGKIKEVEIDSYTLKDIFENKNTYVPFHDKFSLAKYYKNRKAAWRFIKEYKGKDKIRYYHTYFKIFNKTCLYVIFPLAVLIILLSILFLINLVIKKLKV